MKKLLLIATLAIASLYANAQTTYQRKITANHATSVGKSMVQTTDGGYAIAGNAGLNILVVKIDMWGDTTWIKSYAGSIGEGANSIKQTSDGGYIVTGTAQFLSGNTEVLLLKLQSNGNLSWAKIYGTLDEEEGRCVIQNSDGGYTVAGITGGGTDHNVYLLRTNATGTLLWAKSYDGTLFIDDWANSVAPTSDGNLIVTGTADNYHDLFGDFGVLLVMKIDMNGNVIWTKKYGDANFTLGWGNEIINAGSNQSVVTGYFRGNDSIVGGMLLMKIDSAGAIIWKRVLDTYYFSQANSVKQTTDGGYIATGNSFSSIGETVFLVKTNALGDTVFTKQYSQSNLHYRAYSVLQTTDGGYLTTGSVLGGLSMLKTNANGNSPCNLLDEQPLYDSSLILTSNVVMTGIAAGIDSTVTLTASNSGTLDSIMCGTLGISELPTTNSEVILYPNPATNQLTIDNKQYTINEIKIYNLLGECVLQSAIHNPQSEMSLDISGVNKGIYFVEITTANKNIVNKKIIIQ